MTTLKGDSRWSLIVVLTTVLILKPEYWAFYSKMPEWTVVL